MPLIKLPSPDSFGNYWLGDKPEGPAIFISKKLVNGKVIENKKFFASRGQKGGILFDEGGIRYFDTAVEAFNALKVHLEK